jgi:hypothetical protein
MSVRFRSVVGVISCCLLAAACASGGTTSAPDQTSSVATNQCTTTPVNSFQAGTYINADRSTPGPGPERDASTTGESLSYRSLGPAHFSNLVSPEYPDGRRVYWTQGVNGLVKLDYDTYDMLAELPIATDPWTEPEGKAAIDAIETAPAEQKPQLAANLLLDLYVKTNILTSSYAILDRDNHFFMGSPRGLAEYADADPTDPASPIVKVAEVTFPPEVTGTIVGMQITYDGYLVLATDTGYVVAVDRNGLKVVSTVALEHQSEGGPRWVRNSDSTFKRNTFRQIFLNCFFC